jgi:hypothetical protein
MALWDDLAMESKILAILDVRPHVQGHHFGRPFLTAYQIAIAFKAMHPEDCARIGKPVGGKGTGQRDSLAQYIGTELSRRIKSRRITRIEGRFLHRANLLALQYQMGKQTVTSSAERAYDLSMYRKKD